MCDYSGLAYHQNTAVDLAKIQTGVVATTVVCIFKVIVAAGNILEEKTGKEL